MHRIQFNFWNFKLYIISEYVVNCNIRYDCFSKRNELNL